MPNNEIVENILAVVPTSIWIPSEFLEMLLYALLKVLKHLDSQESLREEMGRI